jgi:ABC-type sugar transport system ATPase subunit
VGYKGLLAIQGASFTINKGEIVSLVGSNGSGKSTIVKTIAGLLHPQSGEIVFEGAASHKGSAPTPSAAASSSSWPLRADSCPTRRS